MMVTQHISAAKKYARHISQPTRSSHIMFAIGCFEKLSCIFFPKGQSENFANLMFCTPKGIPTMVIQSQSPVINHAIAVNNPPTKNHMTFAIIFKTFICSLLLSLCLTILATIHSVFLICQSENMRKLLLCAGNTTGIFAEDNIYHLIREGYSLLLH